jgi:molybdenum cofactor cytidylyltransferase
MKMHMRVDTALDLGAKETIAFVGAGGKTTLMFRLAADLVASGHTVVTSTTTRLAVGETDLAPLCLACEEADDMLAQLPSALAHARHVTAVGCVVRASDRVGALPIETLQRIAALPEVDFLLIEADGSRERPFKAPAAHEPVIPDWSTLVIPVVGLDVLGRPLCAESVHRPEIIARLAQSRLDAPITPAMVAAVIGHPQGGGKGAPPGARVVPFLNKADTLAHPYKARETAEALVQTPWIEQVLFGAAATSDAIWERVRRPTPVQVV